MWIIFISENIGVEITFWGGKGNLKIKRILGIIVWGRGYYSENFNLSRICNNLNASWALITWILSQSYIVSVTTRVKKTICSFSYFWTLKKISEIFRKQKLWESCLLRVLSLHSFDPGRKVWTTGSAQGCPCISGWEGYTTRLFSLKGCCN